MRHILIVDDDTELCALLREYLEPFEFVCRFVHNGNEAVALLCAESAEPRPDLVILDVMLPGRDGFAVLAALRAHPAGTALPVIMLTAQGDDTNRVVGLEMGADDYLPKPFNPRELLARMRAVLRRVDEPRATAASGITLDEGALRALVDGVAVELTGQECRLLALLLATPGKLVSRERLCREGLGRALGVFDRSLDMQISRLRKKIGTAADGTERIRSIRGEGYVYAAARKTE